MNTRPIIVVLLVCGVICAVARPQETANDPDAALKQALRYGDLYNWADSASLFAQAEQQYTARGDSRNALYAHIGVLRSTMEQLSLPEVSEELGTDLDYNPLLQADDQLRLFCLVVRGDIDGEIDAVPMRRDWEAALKVAQILGDKKWENRASGEIGFSLFLQGDVTTARQKVTAALIGATMLQDAGAQIRYLAAIGHGFVQLGSYDDALGYFDKALRIAAANPDAGYQFVVNEGRLQAFRSMGKLDEAQELADEIIAQARAKQKHVKETQALITAATVAVAKKDEPKAIEELEAAIDLAQKGRFTRLLADAQFYLEDIYRKRGDLPKAEALAAAAAAGTQSSGDIYLVPFRLQALAQLQASQGKYHEASETYDRASDILDSMIGNVTSAQAKLGLITAMSAIYSEHFTLVASHLNNTSKAFSVLEHARGRVTTDLLMSGRPPDSPKELEIEKHIARLNLDLTRAKSADQVRTIRDQIFLVEEARWLGTGTNPWKARPWETIPLDRVRNSLAPNQMVLEYVLAEPQSYCLAISKDFARVVPLASRREIETMVSAYLKTLQAKGTSRQEASQLYSVLFKDIPQASSKVGLIIVPDGRLHLLPYEALVDTHGNYLVSSHTITYAPSATALYLMNSIKSAETVQRALLGVGGVPYDQSPELNKLATLRGYTNGALANLPASKDEVLAAQSALGNGADTLLIGPAATKSAFERGIDHHSIIHLAVHGFANVKHPDRAALILLSDQQSGDDGILEASEIVHLHTNADLVVLSACDTAVGSLQGEEGVANLSLAFMLAGSKTVVSTLWSIDDTPALYLMKRFYAHLAANAPVADALTAAKRDMIKTYGSQAVPYYWASFRLEGLGDHAVKISSKKLAAVN